MIDKKATRADPNNFHFASQTSVLALDLPNRILQLQSPFYYSGGSTTPPLDLPPLQMDYNLIPDGVRAVGWALSGILVALCIFFAAWTIKNMDRETIRAAQPPFLLLLCGGTLIMAVSIVPMGFQEPMDAAVLDGACMAIPWFLSVGLVTAFSALFSKTWRLSRLFRSSRSLRRIQISARDVLLPFITLLSLNVIVLLLWTLLAPLRWERTFVKNYDAFGREIESYGSCRFSSDYSFLFVIPIYLINVAAILLANYQAYQTKDLPTEFSESGYIFLSIFALVETCFIGAPLLFIVDDNPTSMYLIRAILVTLWCCSILGPSFVPKYRENRRRQSRGSRARPVHVFVDGQARPIRRSGSLSKSFFHRRSGSGPNAPPDQGVGISRIRRDDRYYEDKEIRDNQPSFMDFCSTLAMGKSAEPSSFESRPSKSKLSSWRDPSSDEPSSLEFRPPKSRLSLWRDPPSSLGEN